MPKSPLQKYLKWSLGIHFGALVVFFIISLFHPTHRYDADKVQWVSLPKGTTNQLGSPLKKATNLPKSTIQEQKEALESPPSGQQKHEMTYAPKKVEKKPTKKPTPPNRQGHPDSKINDALSRLQKKVAKKNVEQEASQVPDGPQGGFTDGNSKGSNVSPDDPEYVLYQMKIRQRIMTEWILPMAASAQPVGLLCSIVVHINDKGEVVEKEWDTKSGNPSFDMSAMRAIEKASPLDIPPERLKNEVNNEGFIIEFKPQSQPTP